MHRCTGFAPKGYDLLGRLSCHLEVEKPFTHIPNVNACIAYICNHQRYDRTQMSYYLPSIYRMLIIDGVSSITKERLSVG